MSFKTEKFVITPKPEVLRCATHDSTYSPGGQCYYCRTSPEKQKADAKRDKEAVAAAKRRIKDRSAFTEPDDIPFMEPHKDITANRHGGNQFSAEANPDESAKSRDMRLIYDAFVQVGAGGAIAEDVYLNLGLLPQTGSARCSDLKRLGKLVGTGRRGRTGTGSPAEILVADIYAEILTTEPVLADVEEL